VSAFFFSFLKPGIFFQDQDYYYWSTSICIEGVCKYCDQLWK